MNLLQETTDAWNVRISAYCLMPNHYHMLINTPDGNISRAMRHVNGVYTQRFNSRHNYDGPLFRGRYKSILVSGNAYLLQLIRYIHRNPLKAGITDKLNAYSWSSHKAFLSVSKKWDWLYKGYILDILDHNKKRQTAAYRRFIATEDSELTNIVDRKRWPSMLGPKDFIDWVKTSYRDLKDKDEFQQKEDLSVATATILSSVCAFYNVEHDDLFSTKRGYFNEPTNVAIYLIRRLRRDNLSEIGNIFQVKKYSTISSSITRLKLLMTKDSKQRKRIEDLEDLVYKSQGDLTPYGFKSQGQT